ncbi:MFS transporter [Streptomyces albus subsp. chlorinus]|uniref:MFS transporter n=1 Tax=Streptomyces albus TaxID=1888 RepID=UPI001570CBE1|nr:MFS transporter [Streptomyces albus]NSC23977.1 MFS transporter [Streptomyces albus subsp. chlorinus]
MTNTLTPSPARGRDGTPSRPWPAVIALTGATFSMITAEMLPVGLLTPLSEGLHVSEGSAGLTVTLTGLVAALSAPAVPLALGRLDRRIAVVGLLALLALASAVCAAAPVLPVLLAGRVLTGIALGGVWALAAGLVVRLVPGPRVGRALATVFGGIGLASVLGVPAGTLIGELGGWRSAFAATAALTTVVAVALALLLPRLPAEAPARPAELVRLLGNGRLCAGLLFVTLLVTGHFAAYTYVRPVLERLYGVEPDLISVLLLTYGAAGVIGNFTAGSLATRSPRATLLTLGAGIATATALLTTGGHTKPLAVTLLLLWGLTYGGVSVSSQNWVLAAAPAAREPASALFASVFNAAIALGALVGGRVVDASGLRTVLWAGAALALAALLVLALTRRPTGERHADTA